MVNEPECIEFLFDLVRTGRLNVKSLAHGLHTLVYELIENDYTRYLRVVENLAKEILSYTDDGVTRPELTRQQIGYHMSLVEAYETIMFWDNLSRKYYGSKKREHSTPRKLPDGRKRIIFDTTDGKPGNEARPNSRGNKKVSQRGKARNNS